jgi:NAD-dependent SIR2 family protein deacetylase
LIKISRNNRRNYVEWRLKKLIKLVIALIGFLTRGEAVEDYTKIYDMPPLPSAIVEAVNQERFAVFIGAGISRLAGCISWSELAEGLVEKCASGGVVKLTFRQKQMLTRETDYKKTITIIKEIFLENGEKDHFYEEVHNLLYESGRKAEYPEIYNEIKGIRGLFLTTNIDTHFDRLFGTSVVFNDQDFNYENIDQTKLYHIHGSIEKPEDMVLTLENYFDRYQQSSNSPRRLHGFLSQIFGKYSILFIGYGLGEFEILDYLFTKFAEGSGQQHYILLPFYVGEESLLKLQQYYYKTMNISVVAYRADDLGHARLGDVVKEWVKEIKRRSIDLPRRYKQIDDFVQEIENA